VRTAIVVGTWGGYCQSLGAPILVTGNFTHTSRGRVSAGTPIAKTPRFADISVGRHGLPWSRAAPRGQRSVH
jgi:hypothetical protein